MTLKYADRVLETSSSQGTGTLNLLGPVTGFQSFVDAVGNGNKTVYFIEDGVDWESGIGTITAGSPDTLSRDIILESSNNNAAIDWGPGTRNVFLGASAHALLWRDENGNDTNEYGVGGGTADAQTVTYPNTRAAYSDGMIIRWIASVTNTGAMTVNVNGLGAKDYVQSDGTAFASGQVPMGSLQSAVYDAANDRFLSLVATTATGVTVNAGAFVALSGANLQEILADADAEIAALFAGKQDVNPRVQTVTSATTVTPTNLNDLVNITAQAEKLTIANPTGTMAEGQALIMRIKDDGTAQDIDYDTQYRAVGVFLPTKTVSGKWLYLAMIWNATDNKFDVTGVAQEA